MSNRYVEYIARAAYEQYQRGLTEDRRHDLPWDQLSPRLRVVWGNVATAVLGASEMWAEERKGKVRT